MNKIIRRIIELSIFTLFLITCFISLKYYHESLLLRMYTDDDKLFMDDDQVFDDQTISRNISSRPRVYYSIFAGRSYFMKIHLLYTNNLLREGLVDEVHIWDFCGDNENNRRFIYEFLNHKESGYVLFKIPLSHTEKVTKIRENYLWYSYYNHYKTSSSKYKPLDILIKADDDIVFIDTTQFKNFINAIKPGHIYFPNIVNNDVGLVIQANNGIKAFKNTIKFYEEHGINFTEKFNKYYNVTEINRKDSSLRYICPITYINCKDKWEGGYYSQGDFAFIAHTEFTKDPENFIHKMSINDVNKRFISLKERISVNMFAGNFIQINEIFETFASKYCCEDEAFIGLWPTLVQKDHLIDPNFVIVHFGFAPQLKSRPDIIRFIPIYKKIAENRTAEIKLSSKGSPSTNISMDTTILLFFNTSITSNFERDYIIPEMLSYHNKSRNNSYYLLHNIFNTWPTSWQHQNQFVFVSVIYSDSYIHNAVMLVKSLLRFGYETKDTHLICTTFYCDQILTNLALPYSSYHHSSTKCNSPMNCMTSSVIIEAFLDLLSKGMTVLYLDIGVYLLRDPLKSFIPYQNDLLVIQNEASLLGILLLKSTDHTIKMIQSILILSQQSLYHIGILKLISDYLSKVERQKLFSFKKLSKKVFHSFSNTNEVKLSVKNNIAAVHMSCFEGAYNKRYAAMALFPGFDHRTLYTRQKTIAAKYSYHQMSNSEHLAFINSLALIALKLKRHLRLYSSRNSNSILTIEYTPSRDSIAAIFSVDKLIHNNISMVPASWWDNSSEAYSIGNKKLNSINDLNTLFRNAAKYDNIDEVELFITSSFLRAILKWKPYPMNDYLCNNLRNKQHQHNQNDISCGRICDGIE